MHNNRTKIDGVLQQQYGDLVELIDTLKHEGWHAVQHRCRNGVPYLNDRQIAARLPQRDAINVHNYHPKQRRLESEARVMAKINDVQWIQLVKDECKGLRNTLADITEKAHETTTN